MAGAIPRPHQIVTFVGRFGRHRERAADFALAAGPVDAGCCPVGVGPRLDAGSLDHRGAVVWVGDHPVEDSRLGAFVAGPGHPVCKHSGVWRGD